MAQVYTSKIQALSDTYVLLLNIILKNIGSTSNKKLRYSLEHHAHIAWEQVELSWPFPPLLDTMTCNFGCPCRQHQGWRPAPQGFPSHARIWGFQLKQLEKRAIVTGVQFC